MGEFSRGYGHATTKLPALLLAPSASCSATSAPARSTRSRKPSPATTRSRHRRRACFGVLSLVFWTMMHARLAQIRHRSSCAPTTTAKAAAWRCWRCVTELISGRPRRAIFITLLGIFAAALFYGDSMITPAISVLSAVEGLKVVAPQLEAYVVPITMAVLAVLFLIQKRGTGAGRPSASARS